MTTTRSRIARIFDFDGALTDVEQEGVPFRDGYLFDLADLLGQPLETITDLADRYQSEIGPEEGWLFDGQVVAPAQVDPYLRIMPVARRIMAQFWPDLPEPYAIRLLDRIFYRYNYPKTNDVFRPGARQLLIEQPEDLTWVVTNSRTEPVQTKIWNLGWKGLEQLGRATPSENPLRWLKHRVRGDAKKYVNDPNWEGVVPPSMSLPGLERPVLLRRRLYWETLDGLRQEAGVEWEAVEVIGDIFELDLALPLHCGARVVLMANENTPVREIEFLLGHPRGAVARDIPELRHELGL